MIVKELWRETLAASLEQGTPLITALAKAKIGQEKYIMTRRMDALFAQRIDEILKRVPRKAVPW